jgi:hypothetical protein
MSETETRSGGELTGRGSPRQLVGWGLVAVVLAALAVPWFLWRSDAVVVGLPVWLWWHVGWMLLAAAVFHGFARQAWGLGVETEGT